MINKIKQLGQIGQQIKICLSIKPKLDTSIFQKCWFSDHHAFTTQCIKHQFKNLEVVCYDYSLTGHWIFFYSEDPARGLKVLDRGNTTIPYDYQHYEKLAVQFAKKYGKWSQQHLDFYWCSFLAYMSHVYSKCERPIILQLSFRFEGNQKITPDNVKKLIEVMMEMRSKGQLLIIASNRYDQIYFEYFTGIHIEKVHLCACHITERYNPQRDEILIAPAKHYESGYKRISQIKSWFAKNNPQLKLRTIRELYPNEHKYSDLCRHKAMIVLPYTIYTGAIVEYLSMGIPMFIPSSDLLAQWHVDDYLLVERKSDPMPTYHSMIRGQLYEVMPDPNDDYDIEAVKYWLKFCEWYDWPIETFDSLEELEQKLRSSDLKMMSQLMLDFDLQQYSEAQSRWSAILQELRR